MTGSQGCIYIYHANKVYKGDQTRAANATFEQSTVLPSEPNTQPNPTHPTSPHSDKTHRLTVHPQSIIVPNYQSFSHLWPSYPHPQPHVCSPPNLTIAPLLVLSQWPSSTNSDPIFAIIAHPVQWDPNCSFHLTIYLHQSWFSKVYGIYNRFIFNMLYMLKRKFFII